MAMAAAIVATMPALKHLIRITFTPPFPRKLQKFHSLASLSPNFAQEDPQQQRLEQEQHNQLTNNNKTSRSSSSASYFPKRGQTLELVCESLAFKGKGVCKVAETGFVVMCDRALPGERFIGRVTRRKGSYAEMEFSFGSKKWLPKELLGEKQVGNEKYALGLHAPGFFDKVLNVDKCLLQSEPANMVLAAIQDCWRDSQFGLTPYDVHSHTGFLKHLMLRTGRNAETGLPELMVNFVTSLYKPELLKPLVEKISAIPEVVSIMNNVNTSVGNTSVGEEEYTLYGKSTITEILRGLTFQISANSFFQTNTHQAEVLYKLIEDCAGLRGDGSQIVLDLFCGTGTIGLTLARRAKHVYGYEVVPQAISDAHRNAKLNRISNATFVQGDLNKIDESFGNNFPKPDIVISDPNRPGMHMKLLKFLIKLKAPRIVYVSCNPTTCARDLDYLCHGVKEKNIEGCYKLKSLQPVDMFPHTPHIECICLLELL
ncbi:PREDICTED: zinc finger CCCH domain-containing protein 24 isoform X4 [Populus euphratica]|uniref:Zinc finger CCCH domain-containing protein 24 isoform X4 n=1 Tax=Populus euphratica TaxID=75702 RepID=A0AAJ6TG00_POPEU|nr:PREDICTED: zinc finger CCCH domain-containing protein 24 isoform X4 [Populus euphratica]